MIQRNILRKRTKIVCTIGPATESASLIERLIRSGMNVARLNLSHGTRNSHTKTIKTVRRISQRLGVEVAVLMDLPGPKYRIGNLKDGRVTLRKGAKVTLTSNDIEGDQTLVPVNQPNLAQDIKPGDTVLLDDGAMELRVLEKTNNEVRCRVIVGGILTERRGLAVPGMSISGPFLTDTLKDQILFSMQQEPDYLALSFVSSAEDVSNVRNFLHEQGSEIPLISKIERIQAVRDFDNILSVSDGIMVARGDLGVDIPLERVPLVQKETIGKCNRVGKPVITATQMLESMINAAHPTRAEVTDIANAILDGTDAIMLSGETAIGKYPLAAVRMMARIALETEKKLPYDLMLAERSSWLERKTDELISYNACYTATALGAKAIVAYTQSGSTARRVSKYRPRVPVIGITPDKVVCGRLLLHWGIYPFHVPKAPPSVDFMFSTAAEHAVRLGLAKVDDLIVITGGVPIGTVGTTNLLKVGKIRAETKT
ncbi:MAG: pyruvate kinase [Dehalococcoidales bacterium]|nr:pyruvate kinase [Dehalococcoidales bacterium]